MTRNIILFGATGMLGSYCLNILQRKYNVVAVTKKDYDILSNDLNKLYNILNTYENSVVINCAGSIPQRGIDNENECFILNSLFPKTLEKITLELNIKFIHISTNCVFNYTHGKCNELTIPNETQTYGLSKILGEPEKASVIRTSIIGEELVNKKSLLEWVISNKDSKINGYENYLWNGCTCLELCYFIRNIIETNSYWEGVKHIHSDEIISKYMLLCLINKIYNLNINIVPIMLDNDVNKTLSSIYNDTIITKSIKEQIEEQKNFDLKLGTYNIINNCRCCKNKNLKQIWKLEKAPLAGGFLKDLKDIVHERYYPLTLLYCNNCHSAFVKEVIIETNLFTNINNNGYFYYSSQIPSLIEHFKNLYNYIKHSYDVNNKSLLEIGCNDGVFLNNFSENDNLKYVIGIDPSETIKKIENKTIIKINDFFNSENTNKIIQKYGKVDYVVACNCLAHIDNINDIFKNIKLILNDDGILIMEVHYVKNICEYMNFDFIYHEHMSYYSINGIYNICKNNNLYLHDVEYINSHGGSIRVIIKNKQNDTDKYNNPILDNTLRDEKIIDGYMEMFPNYINKWKKKINLILDNIYQKEKILAGYGASGRTNILINIINKQFDFIFDDSEFKINNFIPLSHIQIFNSSEIYNHNIKTIFLLAWPYAKYIIQKHVNFIKNGGRFIIVLPKIEEINITNINEYLNGYKSV